MKENNNILLAGAGIVVSGIILYLIQPATSSQNGTIDIISCTGDITIEKNNNATVSVNIISNQDNTTKTIKIVAGLYSEQKTITLNNGNMSTINFVIPYTSLQSTTDYTVSVI